MSERRIGIVMNGVTGRMGLNQHLVRSILAIRSQGGVRLSDGTMLIPDPVLVGRNENKLKAIADTHGVARWSTDLDRCLADPANKIYFDSGATGIRATNLAKAIDPANTFIAKNPSPARSKSRCSLPANQQPRASNMASFRTSCFFPAFENCAGL